MQARKRSFPSSAWISAETAPRETSAPSFGWAGQDRDDAELVARRVAELVREDRDDLRRPEELVLEVDEALRAPEGAPVRLEHAEVALRQRDEDALGNRPHDLQLDVPLRLLRHGLGETLLARAAPAKPEVVATSVTAGPSIRIAASCQPTEPRDGCFGRVERVTAVERQVDAADERHLVVDQDDLLVMRVLEPDARVGLGLDARPAREHLHVRLHVPLGRPKDGKRGALPDEQAHVDAACDVREEVAEHDGILLPREVELGREAPAEEVDVRPGAGDRLGDRGQVRRPVDQHLDAVACAGLEGRAAREAELVRVEGVLPAHLAKPAPVM